MNTNTMVQTAQIAFRDAGLKLLNDPNTKPFYIYYEIQNMTVDQQWFGRTLNTDEDIEQQLKSQNRLDLINALNRYQDGFYKQIPDQIGRELIKFYLENLIP